MDSSVPGTSKTSSPASPDISFTRSRQTRSRKRRYISSESSSDIEPVLPENILEVEKNLHASAVKNNLDDVSVKKILKKVVTNDHVLALVKLREEEENKAMEEKNMQPKLTRAKVKELMKVSPKTAWNLENMELTPIKHIPVRTRPEVKALIAQELPEDEDDDEYQPTYDDVPSDDEHTLESCSDVDSQPRTPATPHATSPRVSAIKDGPFKVPQNVTPRRKLDMDEPTIALRTRSKLSLSSIPIDHIESSFVPPDEPPMPAVDDVWTEFLQECLDPETEEVDDDDDPEYDVAADPESHDEDEEGLENIMKISKKELNDLVTELFNVMPEGLGDEVLAGKLGNEVPQGNGGSTTHWEGKQEVISDDEETPRNTEARARTNRLLSIGKSEPFSDDGCREIKNENLNKSTPAQPHEVTLSVVEGSVGAMPPSLNVSAPAPLKNLLITEATLTVEVQQGAKVLPEQISILEQQLRQHIQLATSNFMQLFVHPVHWALAPTYKDYLETLTKITTDNPKSVANVCNLKPAMELVSSWEESLSADTEENGEMVKFIHKEVERSRRRASQNSLYVGDFHPTFLSTVANSRIFLYPHLLPPLPYRSDGIKRCGYTWSEDELITLGIDEFWQYVEDNPEIYKKRTTESGQRWGLGQVVSLVCKHMLPWMLPKALLGHIQHVRKGKDNDNPINKFFNNREVKPVKHVLLPFNPDLTLYEHPEHELPRLWVRYLAKNSKRFRKHMFKRSGLNKVSGLAPAGVAVELGAAVSAPTKAPLPNDFKHPPHRAKPPDIAPKPNTHTYDLELNTGDITPTTTTAETTNVLYSVIQTPAGAYLIPLTMLTNTVNASTPICSSEVQETVSNNMPEQAVSNFTVTVPNPITKDVNVKELMISSNNENSTPIYAPVVTIDHCECCIKLRKIAKRQSLITDYFKDPKQKSCPCKEKRNVKYPKITKKFKLLLENYKSKSAYPWKKLKERITELGKNWTDDKPVVTTYEAEEIAAVTSFQLKLTIRTMNSKNPYTKKKFCNVMSKFEPDNVCPMKAMKEIMNALSDECEDMYKEFLTFLTMEQADKMGKYLDYFKQMYLRDLMQKIEELVPHREIKRHILIRLQRTLSDSELSPCDVCVKILNTIPKYPKLAEYVFSLFPHRRSVSQFANKSVVEMPKLQAMVPIKDSVKEGSTNQKAIATITEQIEQSTPSATDKIQKVADQPREPTRDNTTVGPPTIDKTTADPPTMDNTTIDPPTKHNTTAHPTIENTTADSTTIHNTTAYPPTIENTTADPPTIHNTTAHPPTIENTTADPPTIDNTIADPPTINNTTVDPPIINNTIANPPTIDNTTAALPTIDNTTAAPPTIDNTTAALPTIYNTTAAPLTIDNTTAAPPTIDNTTAALPTIDNTTAAPPTIDNTTAAPPTIDNTTAAPPTIDNTTAAPPTIDNGYESVLDETQQTMDYEADDSSSDDERSGEYLTIVEEPDRMNQSASSVDTETGSEAMDTSEPTVTKTDNPDYSESDMSTMIMSEDEMLKEEPVEWNRDEDKLMLKILQHSLTPEEMHDKTILEIIEQKKVVEVAAENLPDRRLDHVRERVLYLFEFLVNRKLFNII